MTDRSPIRRLQAIIGNMSALSSPERYWLYKLVENLIVYDRLIDNTQSLKDIEYKLNELIDEWYEIQSSLITRFSPDKVAELNARCIPAYRMYKTSKRGGGDECTES